MATNCTISTAIMASMATIMAESTPRGIAAHKDPTNAILGHV